MTEATYPVPDFTDAEAAFGAKRGAYLSQEAMGPDFYGERNVFTRHASSLFFSGGSILPDGYRWKADIDRSKAARAIKALLCSFDPPHEIKIGTVGYALSQWTEKNVTPHQAQRKKAKHRRAA